MCFLYDDNEGTKFSLMKGMSDDATVDAMGQVFAEIETHVRTLCWISRVSSFSNIADAPSRGDCQTVTLTGLGFADVSTDATATLLAICSSSDLKMGRRLSIKSQLVENNGVFAAKTAFGNNSMSCMTADYLEE